MDVLHQDAFVFENITLGPQIETVVPGGTENTSEHFESKRALSRVGMKETTLYHQQNSHLHVPVNFLGLPVATKKTTQDSHAAHPCQFLWHTSISCTLSLSCTKGKLKMIEIKIVTCRKEMWKNYHLYTDNPP